jgi:sterol desaturase/sphingolipid hydroxylase (fatty acid hydroxylase superfamily)
MPKNYVSNATESTRMFKAGWMEALSKVHFSVPLFIYIPVICYTAYLSLFYYDVDTLHFAGYYLSGMVVWSFTEYMLHRFAFHFHSNNKWGKRILFIFHGVHHDYPRDRLRLVMPPSASIPLATLFYFLFSLIFPDPYLMAFFPGFITGYLIYDMMHYAMHHYNFKTSVMKRVKDHHMLHHYKNPEKGFGVSTPFWDKIFYTTFKKKVKKENPVEA